MNNQHISTHTIATTTNTTITNNTTTTPTDIVQYAGPSPSPPLPPPPPPPPTKPYGTSHAACAACKYQRRRCGPECPLAPYFPAEKQMEFMNAHKLFGVSNINKILNKVPEHHKADAINSLIFQANVRAVDKVGGCRRLILDLERRIRLCTTELVMVRKNIEFHRRRQQLWQHGNNNGVYYGNRSMLLHGRSNNSHFMRGQTSNHLMDGRSSMDNNEFVKAGDRSGAS